MTYEQLVYWLKGYLAAHIDCQMKIDIEKAIKEVDETYASSPVGVNPWTSPYPTTITPGQPTTLPGQPFWYTTAGPNGTTTTTTKEVLHG